MLGGFWLFFGQDPVVVCGTMWVSMQYDFGQFSDREKEVLEWLGNEYAQIQSGRITTALLDRITVDMYGVKTMLAHASTISVEDPKTLTIVPYDAALLPEVEAVLRKELSSVEMAVGDTAIRVIAPELTGERRTLLQKTARERSEEAKQSIRTIREKVLVDIKKKKEDSELSEDEVFAVKEDLQKKIDAVNARIEEMYEEKVKDIHA